MTLPEIQKFQNMDLRGSFTLLTSAGFEDRVEAFFKELQDNSLSSHVNESICITYEPELDRNQESTVDSHLTELGLSQSEIKYPTFNRYTPQEFEPVFSNLIDDYTSDKIVIDISGMSKYLIMLVLEILSGKEKEIVIFYAEADVYHPTKNHFEQEWEPEPEDTPAFLTYDIYDVVTSPALSSLTKSGQPAIIIAFPSFNYKKMVALASELSPHLLISIEGVPNHEEDHWRKEAIGDLNREVESYVSTRTETASTFDYEETYEVLSDLYREYADAYRLILSPTGSKLQTVASSLFRLTYSDIQIVYPVMTEFDEDYTEGWKETWGIDLGELDELIQRLGADTDDRLIQIKEKIDKMNAQMVEE